MIGASRVTEIAQLRHPPHLNGPAFDVSSDGCRILSTQLQEGSDLKLVENLRRHALFWCSAGWLT
jgi:hypothetical protein